MSLGVSRIRTGIRTLRPDIIRRVMYFLLSGHKSGHSVRILKKPVADDPYPDIAPRRRVPSITESHFCQKS
jgi:hypothetical protein